MEVSLSFFTIRSKALLRPSSNVPNRSPFLTVFMTVRMNISGRFMTRNGHEMVFMRCNDLKRSWLHDQRSETIAKSRSKCDHGTFTFTLQKRRITTSLPKNSSSFPPSPTVLSRFHRDFSA